MIRALVVVVLAAQATPTFRMAVEVVQIPVSVRDGNRPVRDLSAQDFVVTDAGRSQTVEAVSVESLPVDVTLILDTSGSTMSIAGKLEKDATQILKLIGPNDRLRILRIDTLVEELRPMLPVASRSAAVATPRSYGASSVHDALVAALMRSVPIDRRHLVVGITDGIDTMSLTRAERVRDVAMRSEALLELAIVNPPAATSPLTYVRPRFVEYDEERLKQAAEATGGELRGRGRFSSADPVSTFKRVFDDFRQSYVLRFTPRDRPASGWHELAVSIPTRPHYAIRARPGYFVP
jgi:VWFA-related protein